MISIVIPTLNAEPRLRECLEALLPGAMSGLVKEVIIVDGGSDDLTREIADTAGARIIGHQPGRGGQMAAGAKEARGDWLLFLHADTVLDVSWIEEVASLMGNDCQAGVFTLRFDSDNFKAKIIAAGAMLRTKLFALPYGDQGFLISRCLYETVGGFSRQVLFEDVDMIERLVHLKGRKCLHVFKSTATTSAVRYERNGYIRQVLKNFQLIMRYKMGAEPVILEKEYQP